MQPVIGTSHRCPHCGGQLDDSEEDRNGATIWVRIVSDSLWEFSSGAPIGEESAEPGTLVCRACDKPFHIVRR